MKDRWCTFALITLAMFAAGGRESTFAQGSPLTRFVFEKVQNSLRTGSHLELTASKWNLDLLRASLTVDGVVLRSTDAPSLPALLEAKRLYLNIGLVDLAKGYLVIQDARIESPSIHYVVERDGTDNLPKAPPSSSSLRLLILHGEAIAGSIRVDDAQNDIHGEFPNWHLQIQGDPISLIHEFGFREQQAVIHYQGRSVPINRLDLDAAVQESTLRVHSARISAADSDIQLSGSITDLSAPVLDLRATPNLDLKQISRIAGLEQQLSGRISGTVAVIGPVGGLRLQMQVLGSGVQAPGYEKTDFGLDARAQWNAAAGRLVVSRFAIDSKPGSLTGNADLALNAGSGSSSIHADINDLDLAPLSRQMGSSIEVASRATANVSLGWRGPFSLMALSGYARLRLAADRRVPARNVLPLSAAAEVRLEGSRTDVRLQSASALGARLSGSAVVQSFEIIQSEFRGDTTDINLTMSQLSEVLGNHGRSPAGVNLAGAIAFTAKASGSIQQPRIDTSLDAPALQVGQLRDVGVKATAAVNGPRIAFQSSIRLPREQVVMAQGDLNLTGAVPAVNIDARTNEIAVPALAAMLNSPLPTAGVIQATAHLSGKTDNLLGTASVTGTGLAIGQEPMGNLAAELRFSGGVIRTTRFVLQKDPQHPSMDYLSADISYNLQTGQYSFQANGNSLTFNRLVLPDGTPVRGTVNLTASGAGNVSNPSFNLNLDMRDTQVRDKVLGEISLVAALQEQRVSLQARAPKYGVTSDAHVGIKAPYPADARIDVKTSNTDLLPAPQPSQAFIDATLTGSGELSDLKDVQASVQVRTLDLTLEQQEIHNQGTIEASYRGGSLEISPATIIAGDSTIQLAGTLPLLSPASPGRLTAKAQADLAQLVHLVKMPAGFDAAGKLDVDLLLTGTLHQMDASGSIALDGGSLRASQLAAPVKNISLAATLQNGELVLQRADAQWASARIDITGVLPLGLLPQGLPVEFRRRPGVARFALGVTDLKLESTGKAPEGVSGVISVRLTGQAARLEPGAITAQAVFDQLNVKINQFPLNQVGRSTISLRGGTVSISHLMLQGPETTLQAAGSASLIADGPLDLRVTGKADAAIVALLTDQVKATGPIQLQLALGGTRSAPDFSGFVQLNDAQASIQNPRMGATNLNVRLDLTHDQVVIRTLTGNLNGGTVTGSGSVAYTGGTVGNVDVALKLHDVFLDYPHGLNSALSGDVTAKSSEHSIVIGGALHVLQSSYRQPIDFAGQLLNYLRSEQIVTAGPQISPLLARIRFSLGLRTDTPLIVNNNLAKVATDVNVRLVGTFYQPSVVGTVNIDEGGQIYLNQRTYVIDQGTINLTNQSHVEPDVNIEAQTTAGGYDITLRLTGTPQRMTTHLSADPPLAEPEIVSVLLTGRTMQGAQGTQGNQTQQGNQMQMAQTQALSLIAGQAGQEVARATRALGLGSLRINPGLIAPESDPGARLTVGDNLTKDFSVDYSWSLLNSADQIWVAQYDLSRRFSTQAIKQQDNSYRLGFNHDVRFGGAPGEGRNTRVLPQRKIGVLDFQGGPLFPDKTLEKKLGVGPGDKFDFIKLQKGMDRLHNYYADQKRLEAQIRFDRENRDHTVDLDFNINAGPIVEFAYEGVPVSNGVKDQVAKVWRDGVFDRERLDDAVAVIRGPLLKQGYLQSNVSYNVEEGIGRKLIRFRIAQGARFSNVQVAFPGASAIPASELRDQVSDAKMDLDVYADPQKVTDFLNRYYHDRGYLQANVSQRQDHLDPKTGSGQVEFPVHEGPLFRIGKLDFNGNRAFTYDQLWSVIPTSAGSIYRPAPIADSINSLTQFYHRHGYVDAVVTFRVVNETKTAQANITFDVQEGRQSVIRDIAISGYHQTNDAFVRRQLTFKPGDVLDWDKISQTRQSLYDTGVYSVVEFQPQDMGTARAGGDTKDVRMQITVREIVPYRLQYGAFYDTDRGPGGIVDLSNRNLFGTAADLGARVRYDSDLKEGRLYFSRPMIRHLYLKTDGSLFAQRETRPGFSAHRVGFSLFQEKRLHHHWLFDYGYKYDNIRWTGLPPDPTFYQDSNVPVGRLATTLTRDTRDNLLDATSGSFNSQAFEFGPRWLGSQTGFVRYFGQYFGYVPLKKPVRDENGQLIRPSLIYAGAIRIGLSKAFAGQGIITPERFFAGGGTTMRGFEQDLLGPTEPVAGSTTPRPLGGEAMLLINNEIRFPIVGIFQGVGFVDLGNVYPKLSDFGQNLRKSAGPGLRIKTKFVLLRFDYGFKLDRRPGERSSVFFFSIGQAF